MSSINKSNVIVVAAEASSSFYAQKVLEKFNSEFPQIHFWGVGSKDMEELGFERLGKSEEMAVVGLQEVLVHYKDIKKVFNQLVEQAIERKPKFALLLDYPDFNLRLAKQLKRHGIKVIYYISPQLWAWRKGRIKQVKKYVDEMLVLFPFEKEFYDQHGVKSEFVGHALLDEIHNKFFTEQYLKEQRQRYGVGLSEPVLGLMPGSRNSEIKYNLETQLQTAKQMQQQNPKLKVFIFVAPTFSLEQFKQKLLQCKTTDFSYTLVKQQPFEMIHMADVILTASGTATIMVGLMLKPMVIMYKLKPLTAKIFKFLVGNKIKYFGMINLILDKMVGEEYFQQQANPESMSKQLNRLLNDKTYYQSKVEELKKVYQRLGDKGATDRVVEVLKREL